jgi:hypothetical protein
MIDKVDGNRIGADYNKNVILALQLIQTNPESIPDIITEDDYKIMQKSINKNTCLISFT